MHNSKCLGCGTDSQKLLCYYCHKITKKNSDLWKEATKLWHNLVVGDSTTCSYCKKSFQRDMLCGNHVLTKASRPDLRFDVSNGRVTCASCNDSNNNYKFT